MIFEWDENKERENLIKHGVRFRAAEQVFYDPLRVERPDIDSEWEDRWQTIGIDEDILFVVYTERGETTRIISARLAEPFERRIYYGDSETRGWYRVNP
ncbi:MAG: BrnT family toxin [Treponemataceae bacterium]|nr:MAG: BrnT family toxin [Treponemataceae bacterium]